MKTLIMVMLLLQNIYSQQDSLLRLYLDQSASSVNAFVNNTEDFFKSLSDAAAKSPDTSQVFYFDVTFGSKLEYNLYGKVLNVDFNYIVQDSQCKNSNRNGLLLVDKARRTPAAKKQAEKIERTVYVLIPDKCSTTRFYNAKGTMFCDNKRQFSMEYDEGKATAEVLVVRVGVQLLPGSRVDHYEKFTPADASYPVDNHIDEYVLRCCIRSIIFIRGNEIMENYVSLK